MTTSASSSRSGPKLSARAVDVNISDALLSVRLEDGRGISVPLEWFPRLAEASEEERNNWRLVGHGVGIHWPAIDEDISVENLLGAQGELLVYRDTESVPQRMERAVTKTIRGRPGRRGKPVNVRGVVNEIRVPTAEPLSSEPA